MKSTMILATCLIAIVLLAGCKESGTSATSDFFDPIDAISVAGGSGSGNSGGHASAPEPATLALFGSGLFAYAVYRLKKNKR